MKIFITGATGFIGGAVARTLSDAGHEVLALAHHDEAAESFSELGYEPARGDLRDLDSLRRWARTAGAVVHAGFTGGREAMEIDEAATRVMVEAIGDGGTELGERTFIYTSGVWVLGETGDEAAAENTPTDPHDIVAWRGPLERWLVGEATEGVRTVVIRPGVVFGHDGGIPGQIARGEVPVVGDGSQTWSVIHVDDLAVLYLAAVERAPSGAILHGVGDHVTMLDAARRLTGGEPEVIPLSEARQSLGPLAGALAMNQEISSARTRELTGWRPRESFR